MSEAVKCAREGWFGFVFWPFLLVGGLAFAFVLGAHSGELDPDDLNGVDLWCYEQGARSEAAIRDCIWDMGDVYADLHPEVPRGR